MVNFWDFTLNNPIKLFIFNVLDAMIRRLGPIRASDMGVVKISLIPKDVVLVFDFSGRIKGKSTVFRHPLRDKAAVSLLPH